MKTVRIKKIDFINGETLRLFFTNGDIGTLGRKSLSKTSGWKILPKHFKEASISDDGILILPIFINAELEDGTVENIPIEMDPITIHELAQIENFEKVNYNFIRNLRKSRGLTLEEVSNRIGVSKQYLGSVERGEIENIGTNTLKRIIEIGLEDNLILLTKVELDDNIDQLMKENIKATYDEIQKKLKASIGDIYE